MARKSHYDKLVDAISKRLDEMAPENCETVEEAAAHAARLADMGLCTPSCIEDYSYCPTCKRPCYRGICQMCE